MKKWANRVLTADYSSGETWAYMDKVGVMHTGVSPFKHQRALGVPPLNVPCPWALSPFPLAVLTPADRSRLCAHARLGAASVADRDPFAGRGDARRAGQNRGVRGHQQGTPCGGGVDE
jgi:hypothetical protein